MTTTVLFYIFSAVLLAASFRVITARNTVHSALFLVLAFFNAACVWMLLDAEFLAIVLVLVYVGAVMVLFLFVVMMLDINTERMREGFWSWFPLAAFVGVLIALEMALVLMRGHRQTMAPPLPPSQIAMGNTHVLGVQIYTQYLYPLQLAAVLLLVAMIAAVTLTLRKRKDAKGQDPGVQVLARKGDRLKVLKMAPVESVIPPPPAPPAAPAAGVTQVGATAPAPAPAAAPNNEAKKS